MSWARSVVLKSGYSATWPENEGNRFSASELVAQLLWFFGVLRKIGDRLSKLQNGVCCLLISLYDILIELLAMEGCAGTCRKKPVRLWIGCLVYLHSFVVSGDCSKNSVN